ncbi:hypothetical protein [Kiloniella majae]|uniref:hypothetical protein n=1 Tax=Kiloniella majae TaxID=1938558 RepID=UPI000A277B32|nr:hypothetical protein [Kiloniella majae]
MSEEQSAEAPPVETSNETPNEASENGGFFDGKSVEQEQEGFLADKGDAESNGDEAPKGEQDNTDDKPVEYEFKLPDGIEDSEETQAYTNELKTMAQALKLSPEQAQALLELDIKAKTEGAEEYKAAQEKDEKDKIKAAEKAVIETKAALKEEWGGDTDKNVRTANRALKEFGGSELEGVLNEAGVLNNATVIRAFHKAGLSLVEDSSPGGAGATKRNKSAAEILYPDEKKG